MLFICTVSGGLGRREQLKISKSLSICREKGFLQFPGTGNQQGYPHRQSPPLGCPCGPCMDFWRHAFTKFPKARLSQLCLKIQNSKALCAALRAALLQTSAVISYLLPPAASTSRSQMRTSEHCPSEGQAALKSFTIPEQRLCTHAMDGDHLQAQKWCSGLFFSWSLII